MKIILAIIILSLAALGAIYFNQDELAADIRPLHVGEGLIRVKVAKTPEERAKGLQYVSSLGENEGMLFVFGNPEKVSFWNKNTLIDLDLVWVRDFQVLGTAFLPKEAERGIVTADSPDKVNFVIEAPAGWAKKYNIRTGDTVTGL